MSRQVSAFGPLSSRTEKQIVRLLVGMYKLSKPFSTGSEPVATPLAVRTSMGEELRATLGLDAVQGDERSGCKLV